MSYDIIRLSLMDVMGSGVVKQCCQLFNTIFMKLSLICFRFMFASIAGDTNVDSSGVAIHTVLDSVCCR